MLGKLLSLIENNLLPSLRRIAEGCNHKVTNVKNLRVFEYLSIAGLFSIAKNTIGTVSQ
jgi:hypothetical protein